VGAVLNTGVRGQGSGFGEDHRLLIKGGTVVTEKGAACLDLRVLGEKIAAVGKLTPEQGENVVDATGLFVLPGMFDVHVHIDDRIGGCELADTFPSASEIAVRTGVTTVAGFVTQGSDETLSGAVAHSVRRGTGRSHCDFTFHLTPTGWPWDWREVEALISRGFATFKVYTTYREAGLFRDYSQLEQVMTHLARLEARLLVHCEDDATLMAAAAPRTDPADARGHAVLRPERAETVAIEKVLEVAGSTGCEVHVVHVSTAEGIAIIGGARGRCRVSCETAPHYVLLDDSALAGEGGYRFLCTPPLRAAATRARVEAAAAAGAFDLYATDHCPFTREDKDRHREDFRKVPKGLAGLGALVPLVHEVLVKSRGLPLAELATRLAANPAKLLGLYPRKGTIAVGSDADLVFLAPDGSERAVVSSLADCHETYPGRTSTLDVRQVLLRGTPVVKDNALLDRGKPRGVCLAGS
jgi:dihydropyrimidinase